MIKVDIRGFLYFKEKSYKCVIGKNGARKNKVEGDGCTPLGTFSLGPIFYRSDRVRILNRSLETIPIKKNMYWSDDPKSKNYNQLTYTKGNSFETLYKDENIYDIILPIHYNINPIIAFKGSAIFIHVVKNNFSPTEGCIALKKNCLLKVIKDLSPKDKIKIFSKI